MKQTIIPIKSDARVSVKCSADLSVEGSEESTLVVIVDQGDSLRMREDSGVYRIQADTDCRIILPVTAMVTIEKASGNGQLRKLKNRVVIGKIGGNLKIEDIGGASIESIGGDCHIKGASGAIELARIGGELTANDGLSILAGGVGGDVTLSNFTGKTDITAGDDVSIQIPEGSIPEIHVRAGSDIELFLPVEANCQLELQSGDECIKVHAGGQDFKLEDRLFSIPLGTGGAIVQLIAGDNIFVSDSEKPKWHDESSWDSDHWSNFGFDISRKVRDGLKIAGDSVDMAIKQAEKAGKRAGREVERVLRDLDGKGLRSDHFDKVVGFSMEVDQSFAGTKKSGPSDEERMLVLKMLQEKKITVEEAEKLLNALEH